MSSKITMPADSTQMDERQSTSRKRRKISHHDKKKVKKTRKVDNKKKVERRRRPSKDSESDTDSDDSDLDLDKKLKPMATYVKQRDVLVEQMFHCISKKKLKRMLPEILKTLAVEELKRLCLEQLEVMSKKRIRRILEGDDPENISSSGTEEETTDAEEGDEEEAAKQEEGQDILEVLRDEIKGISEEVGDVSQVRAPDSTAVSAGQQQIDQVHSEGLTVDKSPSTSRRNSVKSEGSSYHSSDDSLSSDYSRSRSRSASRSRRSRSRTRSRSRSKTRSRSRSRTRSRSRYRTRSRSGSRSYRSRSRSLPYDRSTKSRTRSPSVSSPDREDWGNRPDNGFYARMPEDMTPPPVKILVPKPSSPGTPEEGEVTDDDDDAQYVVVRHADGRTEVVTKEEEESKESGIKSEKTKEYEMVDENKVTQEDSEEDRGVKFEYIIATKMKPKAKGSKIVKRDEEGNVIDTGDSDNHPGDGTEGTTRSVPNVTEEKKDQTGNEKDAFGSNENDKGLKEKITEENSKSEGEKGAAEPSGSEIQKGNDTGNTCDTNPSTCASHFRETESEENVEQTEDPVKDDETCINEEPETVIHVDDERPLKAEKLDVTDSEINENEDISSVQQTLLETLDDEESSAPIDATEQDAGTVVRNTSSILFSNTSDIGISTKDEEVIQDNNKEESPVEKKTSGIIFGKVYTDSDILLEDEKLEPTLLVVPAEGSTKSPQSENEGKEKREDKTKKSGVGFYVESSEEETEVDVDVKDESHSSGEYEELCKGDKVSKVSKGEEGKIKRSKIKDRDIAKKHVSKQVTDAYDNEEEHEETEGDKSKLNETKREKQDCEHGNKSKNKLPEKKKKIDVSETMGHDHLCEKSKKTIKKRKNEDKVSEVPVKELKAELSKPEDMKFSSEESLKRTDENKKEEGEEKPAPSVRRIKVQGAIKPSTKDSTKKVESSEALTTDRRLVQKKESSGNESSLSDIMIERNDSGGTQPMPVARKVVVDGTTGQRRLKASVPGEEEEMEEELDYDDEEVGREGCPDSDIEDVPSNDEGEHKGESKPEFDRQTTRTKRKIMVLQTGGLIVRSKTESEEMPRKELNKERVQPVTPKASAPRTGELNKKTSQPKETSVTESKQKSKTLETKGSKGSIADKSITKHASQFSRQGTSSVRDNIKAEELRIQKLKEELRKREDELRRTAAAARLKAAGLLKEDLAVALIGKQPSKPDEEVPSTSKAATKGKQNYSDDDDDDVKLATSENSDDEDASETEKRSDGRSSSVQRSYGESESDSSESEYDSEDDRRKRSKRTSHRKSDSYSRSRSRSREKSRRSKKSRSRSRSRHSTERSRSGYSRDKRPKERSYSGRMRSDEMGEDYDRHKKKPKIESSVSRVGSSDKSRRKNWPPPEFPDPRDLPPHFFDYPPPPEFFEQFGPMPYFFFPRGRGRGRFRGRGRGAFMYPTSPRRRDYEKYGGSRTKYHGRSRSYERSRSRTASRSRSRSYEKEKSHGKHHRSPHYDRDRSYERDYNDRSRSREKGPKYNRKSGEQSPMRKKKVTKTGQKGKESVIERRFVKVEPLEKRIKAPEKEKQVRAKSSTATKSESKSSRSKASTSKETKSSAKLSPKPKPGTKCPIKVTSVKKPTKKAASSGESSGKHNQEGKRKKSEGIAILTESQMEILELEMRARAIKAMLQEAKSKEAKKMKKK